MHTQKIGILFAVYVDEMTNDNLSERFLPGTQEASMIQRHRLNAFYHCSKCGSAKLNIVFKVGDARVHPYFHCHDCQMEERIS
jgi:hypothetical protein